ncbi:MFS transporter [Streptomyces sp. NPDC088354]|uniref:MFS transporter n=1 Tax=Streptomyces sp. NPDC088354 TaxID=3365856 RepID=UPI00383072AC
MTPTTSRPPRLRFRFPDWAGRNFRLLAAAAFVTNLGTSGAVVASAFAVLRAGGDATDVGLVAAARTVPLVVFLLIGGAVADRLPRHRVMVAANCLNAVSQGVFALLVISGEARIWQMAVLAALGGTGTAFFAPANEGMLLSTVDGAHAGRAFAVFRLGVNGANVGGAALAGALIALVGPGWVLAVDAACFALAASLRALLRVTRTAAAATPGGGLLRDLHDGWREFASRRWLWGIVVQFSVVNAVMVAAEAVYGPLVSQAELGGAGPWGAALAAFGVGNILGGFLMLRWRPRRILLAGTLCVFPFALPAVALALVLPVPLLAATMLVAGLSIEVFGVTWMLALRQEIPEDKLSRVAAYDWFGSVSMIPLGTALAGPAAGAFGLTGALWGCAGLAVLLTGAVLLAPEVRALRRKDTTAEVAGGGPAPVVQPIPNDPPGGSGEGTASLS